MYDVFINTSVDKAMWGLPLSSVRSESGVAPRKATMRSPRCSTALRTLKTFNASLSAEKNQAMDPQRML